MTIVIWNRVYFILESMRMLMKQVIISKVHIQNYLNIYARLHPIDGWLLKCLPCWLFFFLSLSFFLLETEREICTIGKKRKRPRNNSHTYIYWSMFIVVLKEDSHKEKLSNYFSFSSSYISIYQHYTYSCEGLNKNRKQNHLSRLYRMRRTARERDIIQHFILIICQRITSFILISYTFGTSNLSSFFIENRIISDRRIEQCLMEF